MSIACVSIYRCLCFFQAVLNLPRRYELLSNGISGTISSATRRFLFLVATARCAVATAALHSPPLHAAIDPETPCRGLRRGSAGMPGNQRRDPLGSASDYLPLMGDTEGGLIRLALCS
jgi:hypothetical protein